MSDLTPYEQYLLELINRARADPGAEAARLGISLNQGLSPGTIQDTEKQPLAANEFLNNAAADHSSWMLQANIFSHTGQGNSSAGDRIEDAGYTNWRTWGENISYRGGGNVQSVSVVEGHHDGLFLSSGHRRNLLNNSFTEIGLGQEFGQFNNFNASMLTQNFASDRGDPFLLGVVFDDKDGDDFFDPGEELPDVRVAVSGEGATQTGDGGGYEIRIDDGGSYTVTFSGGGLDAPVTRTVQIGAENVKLDLNIDDIAADIPQPTQPTTAEPETPVAENPDPGDGGATPPPDPETSDPETPGAEPTEPASPTPTTPVAEAPLRLRGGDEDDRMTGGGADEIMIAGRGADVVRGQGGDDLIRGQAGDDRLIGGVGDDTLAGGGGKDNLIGNGGADSLRGGGGSDTLKGGRGDDALTGNGGADVFQFAGGHGSNTITDFGRGGDRIEILRGADEFADLSLSQTGDGVVVAFGAASILLTGVSEDELSASDFIF